MVKNSKTLLIGLFALILGIGFGQAGEKIRWRLSHTGAPDTPYHMGSLKFAEEVEKRSNGEFIVEVHHSSVLGWEREVLEAQQLGTLEMSLPALGPFAIFVPSFDRVN